MDNVNFLTIIIGVVSFIVLMILVFLATLRYTLKVYDARLSDEQARNIRSPFSIVLFVLILGFCSIIMYAQDIATYLVSLD